jgi:hypothetical protein
MDGEGAGRGKAIRGMEAFVGQRVAEMRAPATKSDCVSRGATAGKLKLECP